MSLHLHCPYCGELLAEDQLVVTTSARDRTRQETYDLACRCGTRVRLQLPPERWAPSRRRRHGRRRGPGTKGRVPEGTSAATPATHPPTAEVAPRPTAERPYPFTHWQYARLLMLRGRVRDGELAEGGETADDGAAPA